MLARPAEVRARDRAAGVEPPAVGVRATSRRAAGAIGGEEEVVALAERQPPRGVDGAQLLLARMGDGLEQLVARVVAHVVADATGGSVVGPMVARERVVPGVLLHGRGAGLEHGARETRRPLAGRHHHRDIGLEVLDDHAMAIGEVDADRRWRRLSAGPVGAAARGQGSARTKDRRKHDQRQKQSARQHGRRVAIAIDEQAPKRIEACNASRVQGCGRIGDQGGVRHLSCLLPARRRRASDAVEGKPPHDGQGMTRRDTEEIGTNGRQRRTRSGTCDVGTARSSGERPASEPRAGRPRARWAVDRSLPLGAAVFCLSLC